MDTEVQESKGLMLRANLRPTAFTVVDNFYADVDSVRRLALSTEYSQDYPEFPGRRSNPHVTPEIREFFEKNLSVDWESSIEGCPFTGCFQLMLEEDASKTYVHVDRVSELAALVYLNPDRDEERATSFYRHKLTGFTEWPETLPLLDTATRLAIPPHDILQMFTDDRFDLSKWERIISVPMRYNRMVIFRGNQFHRNESSWGHSPDTGRLTQAFFLRHKR